MSLALQKKIDYVFRDRSLLIRALTHKSAKNNNNEKLEFLGDSVLSLAISDLLIHCPERFNEGEMTKIRSELVRESSLARIANDLDLENYMIFGNNYETSKSCLADAVEALIGAVFLDGGFEAAKKIVCSLYIPFLSSHLKDLINNDYKSRLQELAVEVYKEAPTYVLYKKEGPENEPRFHIDAVIKNVVLGRGAGQSKKEASQAAAKQALSNLMATRK